MHNVCCLLCTLCVSYYAQCMLLLTGTNFLIILGQKNIGERNYKKVAYIPFYNNQAIQLANDFAGRKETVVSVSAIVNFSHLYKY